MSAKFANFEQALLALMEEHDVTLYLNEYHAVTLRDGFDIDVALHFLGEGLLWEDEDGQS